MADVQPKLKYSVIKNSLKYSNAPIGTLKAQALENVTPFPSAGKMALSQFVIGFCLLLIGWEKSMFVWMIRPGSTRLLTSYRAWVSSDWLALRQSHELCGECLRRYSTKRSLTQYSVGDQNKRAFDLWAENTRRHACAMLHGLIPLAK